jgi:predicted phage terminase large subunit-like protein
MRLPWRHPFLVERDNGEREWVRVCDLEKGDKLVLSRRDRSLEEFAAEPICSICQLPSPEEVFDIQIEDTECFLADGLVSHNTRWHEDDLVGRLLELQKHDPQADQWRVVCFPAVFEGNDEYTHPSDRREIGESLWPGKYPLEDLNRIKATLGSYEWAGLFQQRPAPSGGGIFMTSWWGYYDNASLPNGFDEIIQSWDMTFKDAGTSDFVVGQVWARAGERYYLLDQVRERLDFPGTIRAVMNLSYRWPEAKLKLVEDKANGPAVISMLKRELSGLVPVEPQGSKEARAYAVSALVESGNVFLPARASWLDDFIAESASFPNGRHDDQIDAMTQALNRLSHRKGRWSFIAGRK